MHYPVFYDPTGRRARWFSAIAKAAAAAGVIVAAAFCLTLLIAHPNRDRVFANILSPRHLLSAVAGARPMAVAAHKAASTAQPDGAGAPPGAPRASVPNGARGAPLTIGFYVNWDDNSFPALRTTLPHLDWVVPAWLSLRGPDMALVSKSTRTPFP